MIMEITIIGSSLVSDVQQTFSEAYPFLRVEFFKKRHTQGKMFLKEDKIPPYVKIGDLSKNLKPGKIDISDSRTVTEFEQQCREMTGLEVQVLRRSGSSWIQTSLTDDWSLERQNREGELLNNPQPAKTWEQAMEDRVPDME